jgi:hypothetical protein
VLPRLLAVPDWKSDVSHLHLGEDRPGNGFPWVGDWDLGSREAVDLGKVLIYLRSVIRLVEPNRLDCTVPCFRIKLSEQRSQSLSEHWRVVVYCTVQYLSWVERWPRRCNVFNLTIHRDFLQ